MADTDPGQGTTEELARLLQSEGIEFFGVADAVPAPNRSAEYEQWVRLGYAGEMSYLRAHQSMKYDPAKILADTRSIILVGLNYYQESGTPPKCGMSVEADTPRKAGTAQEADTPQKADTPRKAGTAQEADTQYNTDDSTGENAETGCIPKNESPNGQMGRIARYAWGRDYHKELGKRLKRIAKRLRQQYPDQQFRPFTDATPLAERYYAERAGMGFAGRNTLLISPEYGSWFVIGEILSTVWFPQSSPNGDKSCPRLCRRCIDACPTGALIGPHRINASRCISYLTIEYDGVIPEDLQGPMGHWLFGCDVCQEVCPFNQRARPTAVQGFLRPIAGNGIDLKEVLSIRTDDEFTARFAGSPLMRAKRRRLVRNACVVAANTGAVELVPLLERLAEDPDTVIAGQAAMSLGRLFRLNGTGNSRMV